MKGSPQVGKPLTRADSEDLDVEVAGEYNTLRVYVFMLKTKSSSSRNVQERLGFSNPALAQHHQEKLKKFSLVTKDYDGTYHVKSNSFGILKLYVKTGKWIIPRTIFFVIIFSILTGLFLPTYYRNPYFLIVSVVSILGLAIALFETIRSYRILPPT